MIRCKFYYNDEYHYSGRIFQKLIIELSDKDTNESLLICECIYDSKDYSATWKQIVKPAYFEKIIGNNYDSIFVVDTDNYELSMNNMKQRISNKNNFRTYAFQDMQYYFFKFLNHTVANQKFKNITYKDFITMYDPIRNYFEEIIKIDYNVFKVVDSKFIEKLHVDELKELYDFMQNKNERIKHINNKIFVRKKQDTNLVEYFSCVNNKTNFFHDKNYIKQCRNIIKLAKVINNTGLKLVKDNFYQFIENPNNSNYIVIDGINVNRNRVEFIDVYETPPVSNADA